MTPSQEGNIRAWLADEIAMDDDEGRDAAGLLLAALDEAREEVGRLTVYGPYIDGAALIIRAEAAEAALAKLVLAVREREDARESLDDATIGEEPAWTRAIHRNTAAYEALVVTLAESDRRRDQPDHGTAQHRSQNEP